MLAFLILLISNVLNSACTNKRANNTSPETNKTVQNQTAESPDTPAQPDTTADQETQADPDTPAVQETQADPDTPADPDSPAVQETQANPATPANPDTPTDPDTLDGRRRLSLLTNDNCKGLDTQDNDKYKCVVSEDQTQCIEVKKENSNSLKLSAFSIIFLFLI